MFFNLNHLNEGNLVKNAGVEQKKLFAEGENPRTEKIKESGVCRHETRTQSQVNINWIKLRK